MSTSNGYDKTVEVITIDSDDEDQHDLPQIQDVFQVEEYFLPLNHFCKQRSKESFYKTSEKQISVEELLVEEECLNSVVGDIVPQQSSGKQTSFSFQVLSADTDNQQTEQKDPTELLLQRLAEDLVEVISVSLGKENSNKKTLSNLEKTIWEVSQSDFDISDCVPPRSSKGSTFSENKRTRSRPQKTFTNGSAIGNKKSISLNKSQTLRLNEQSTPVKKNRGRPLGWRKNKNFSYFDDKVNEIQKKEDGGEICQFPQNSESINNLIPKESDVRAGSSLSSTMELTSQSLKPYQCDPELPTNVSEAIDTENEIIKTDFVTCYNRIFDDKLTDLCMKKMGDLIFLSMMEEGNYKQRLATEKTTREQLRGKKKEILKTSFLKVHDKYKISFATMFQDIVDVILSSASTIKLQKMLLLSWFVKLFLKITDLLPEHSDSPISVWKIIIDLLSNYENPSPMVEKVFSLSEVDFEKECWKTLYLIQQSFSEESNPEITSVSEIAVEETRATELQETPSNSIEPSEIQLDGSRQNLSNPTDTNLGEINETEVQNVNCNVDILPKTSHQEVSVIVNQQLALNILETASRVQPESLNIQLASQDHQSNGKVVGGSDTQKETSVTTETFHNLIGKIIETAMKKTSQTVSPTHVPDLMHRENATNLSFKTINYTVLKSNREFETSSKSVKRKVDLNFEHTGSKIVKTCAERSSLCDVKTQQSEITSVGDIRTVFSPVSTNVPCTTTITAMSQKLTFEKYIASKNQPFCNSVNKMTSMVKPDKHSNQDAQFRLDTSGPVSESYLVSSGFNGYPKIYPNIQGNLSSNRVNTNINFQSRSNFHQPGPTYQNSLPKSDAPRTVMKNVTGYGNSPNFQPSLHSNQVHQFVRQGLQPQYSRTNLNQNKTYHTQNQQMPRPANIQWYPIGMSNFNNHCPYQTDGTQLSPHFINHSSLRRHFITSNTATDKVFQPNQGEPKQTIQSVWHTVPQSNFITCVSDFTEQLEKQISSGSLTISSVKDSQTPKESCQDTEQSVVPEVLPKEVLHYKPSPSNQSWK